VKAFLNKLRNQERYSVNTVLNNADRCKKIQRNNFMILHQITVLPHLETLVQNCDSCEQTPEHTTEHDYRCAHHKETHTVARKLPVLQIWR
jgi:hypothetical protein